MKIDPQLPPLPQPGGAPQPAAGSPFQSFEDMLGGEAAAQQPEAPQRAMAFVELGMFGRGGVEVPGADAATPESQVAAAAGGAAAPLPAAPAATPEQQVALAASHPATGPALPQQEVTPAAQQALAGLPAQDRMLSAGRPADSRPRTTAPIFASVEVASEGEAIVPAGLTLAAPDAEGAETAEPFPAAAPDAPERHEEKTDAPLRLAFHERDGSASIVAAAGSLTPEQRASLRRRTAELLLEHGIMLSKFTLNGAALGGLAHYRNGDTHGPRTN
ncbi:MAG: hypothetical protein E6G94_00655 [Alphaproteobacteria bacterium]|nr:MAG: hypothetical protein E6G94_00655 [Alphaproteobacteria bacterium]